MASALASPPPLWTGGSSDLKRHARTFLERALVISALVHLAAVGVFRGAYERMVPKEEETVLIETWHDPTIIETPPHIQNGWRPPGTAATQGKYEPRPDDSPFPVTRPGAGDTRTVTFDPGSNSADPPTTHGDPMSPPPSDPAFRVAEIFPVPISAPLPVYPEFAKDARIEGRVIVKVLVGIDGSPEQVIAVSGPKMLFDAAVEGVRKWKFKPGMTSGQAVEVWVAIPVVFRLGS